MKTKITKGILLISLLLVVISSVNAQIINTIAGTGISGFSGDGGLATSAELYGPAGVCNDAAGNIYITDPNNSRIRKIDGVTGIITTIAGTGIDGYSGDGGLATAAKISLPVDICFDSNGDLYFSDEGFSVVRKITSSTGIISTLVGTGIPGYSGDGASAINAQLDSPLGISLDDLNNLYIADKNNHRIRMVTNSSGIISTVVGTGVAGNTGNGGSATSAQIDMPISICFDTSGNIYFSDAINNVVRKITVSTGIISSIAGTGINGYSGDGGAATIAQLDFPAGICMDGQDNLFIADYNNKLIRKVTKSNGFMSTISGEGMSLGDGGPALMARFQSPIFLCLNFSGDLFVSDEGDNRVRKITGATANVNDKLSNKEIFIYPNPASNNLSLVGVRGKANLKMYDMLGKVVLEYVTELSTAPTDKVNLNTIQFENGLYILVIENETGNKSISKIIINK